MRRRQPARLPTFDYTSPGAYFLTVCAFHRELILGEIEGDRVLLSRLGEVARVCWGEIPMHFAHVELDVSVVMPNHIHGIIILNESVGATHASPLRNARGIGQVPGSLSAIVGSFKSASSRRINQLRGTPGAPVWQRGFYDHVIRNDEDLARIREYIATNPLRWSLDEENPSVRPGT